MVVLRTTATRISYDRPGAVLDPEFWGGPGPSPPYPLLPSFPFPTLPFPSDLPTTLFPLPTPPLPLEVGPLNAARGSEGAHLGQNEQLWCQQFHGFQE